MNLKKIINHQSNGAKEMRIAASIIVILGWLSLAISLILALVYADEVIFILPIIYGIVSLGVSYLIASVIRGLASLAEVAQLYWNNTVTYDPSDDE
jgi:uncharacterized protein YqhQ